MQSKRLYQFGDFELDPAEHRLRREGQTVVLAPKTFDLLIFLIGHPGRLLTKDQILEAVWPESFVEEANLTVSISALRRALGEKRGEPQFIDTIPKRGYRFTAQVIELEVPLCEQIPIRMIAENAVSPPSTDAALDSAASREQPATSINDDGSARQLGERERKLSGQAEISWAPISPTASRLPKALIAGVLAMIAVALTVTLVIVLRRKPPAVTSPKRIAVLPFQNLRHDPANDFLGFSLADAIINRLGYVSELTIRPSYAVQKYRTDIPDIQQVSRELGVDTLLTGSFIRESDNLRVSYQLVDAKSDRILRHGTIDLQYQNLFDLEDHVSAQVIAALSLSLTPSESAELKSEPPVPPLAYEYYLRGVDLYSRNEFLLATKMLERSTEIYPAYALTWAHLGRSYTAAASFQFGGEELYQKAQAAYERALALQPNLLTAKIYMANLLTDTGKPEQAVPLVQQVLAANSNLAEAHWELGYAYRYGGMLQESVRECERARKLDPSVKLTSSAINGYLYLGDFDTFLRSLPPANDSAYIEFYRGFALYHMHQWDGAAEALDHAYQLDSTMLQTQVGKALSHHIRHEDDKGIRLLTAAENKATQRSIGDAEAIYKFAQAYAELDDTPSALRTFRRSIEKGFFPYSYFVRDPLMANVRKRDEFQRELEKAHERSNAFKSHPF